MIRYTHAAVLTSVLLAAGSSFGSQAQVVTPAGPTTAPTATTPTLTELPDGLARRVSEVSDLRRNLLLDLSAARSAAYRRFRTAVPDWSVLRSASARAEAAPVIIESLRVAAQIDFASVRVGSAGTPRDYTLYGIPQISREVGHFHAVMLKLAGDDTSASVLTSYYSLSPEAVEVAARFVASDEPAQREQAQALAEQLDKGAASDGYSFDAVMLILKREFASDPAVEVMLTEKARAVASNAALRSALTRYESQLKSKATMGQLNQPVEIRGKLVDGTPFSTADLQGKVVLIDFWATWCGPCKAELPRLKALYAQYKDQGFEIVGISNDVNREKLETYLKADPTLTWPQLFDDAAAADSKWHPTTTGFGITGIPVFYLIDRKGVLRSVTARRDLETLLPQLLAEK